MLDEIDIQELELASASEKKVLIEKYLARMRLKIKKLIAAELLPSKDIFVVRDGEEIFNIFNLISKLSNEEFGSKDAPLLASFIEMIFDFADITFGFGTKLYSYNEYLSVHQYQQFYPYLKGWMDCYQLLQKEN